MILWPKDNEIVKTIDKFGVFRNREEESHKNCYFVVMLKQTLQQTQTTSLSPLRFKPSNFWSCRCWSWNKRYRGRLKKILFWMKSYRNQRRKSQPMLPDSYEDDDQTPSYKLYVNNYGKDQKPQYNTFSVQESFHQNLIRQLGFCSINERRNRLLPL